MVSKASVFFILLLVVGFGRQESTYHGAARPVPFLAQQRYSRIFATLGVVCKCCDGAATAGVDQCPASWLGDCSNIQCLPWKLHS